ncbi:MAG TPA: GvpL/GvpF family gas vesicle protein [Thermoanaerobaculia bacterium]|nr:GvpL/GvpF family gas vesicle protein [Thermoanaerobaculia bacterium]
MKQIAIGAHLRRDDVESVADAIPVGELFLSAVEVADDQPLGDRELLIKVAGVRARLLDVATFVAIRYGFTLTSPADAESKCAAHLGRWRQLLIEHREHVEMTLKVAAASSRPRPDRRDFTNGADYLRALHAATQAANIDGAFREHTERLIVPVSVKHRWTHRDERSVELAALIPRARLEDVYAAGEELRRVAPDVPFLLSGPWPLEVFADDDRE